MKPISFARRALSASALALTLVSASGPAAQAGEVKASWGVCRAWTYCPNSGLTVSCETEAWGNPSTGGQACTWYVQPYEYVQCTGMAYDYGQNAYAWTTITASCFGSAESGT